ncbi:LPS export ABC transporter permease LptG [Carnimonas bestiolae]|uniref:LPS export ABC transporter permease LptG n=1 Tax=Carnimonas bestiolae TaxID=3402172 RepID=UPI003EDC574E
MFSRFDRYIARNVFAAMLVTEVALVALNLAIVFIDKLDGMEGNYGVFESFIYQCLRLPWRLYEFAPLAVLLGGLIGLGNMAASNELTAMRAAGASITRLTLAALKPMLVISIIVMAMGQWLVPNSEQLAQSYKSEKQQKSDVASISGGAWEIDGETFFNFGGIRLDDSLVGIERLEFDGSKLRSISYGARGEWDADKKSWHIEDIKTTRFYDDHTKAEHQDSADWKTRFDPEFISQLILDMDTHSISGLWQLAHYQDAQGVSSNSAWLYFWQKILQPLSFISLMLVAASSVFGPLRSKSAGTRIFIGIIVALCVKYLQDLLAPASLLFGFPPLWAVLIPILLCVGAGLYQFKRNG